MGMCRHQERDRLVICGFKVKDARTSERLEQWRYLGLDRHVDDHHLAFRRRAVGGKQDDLCVPIPDVAEEVSDRLRPSAQVIEEALPDLQPGARDLRRAATSHRRVRDRPGRRLGRGSWGNLVRNGGDPFPDLLWRPLRDRIGSTQMTVREMSQQAY